MTWIELLKLIGEHQTQQDQQNLQEEIKQLWQSQLYLLRIARNADLTQSIAVIVAIFACLFLGAYLWWGINRRLKNLEGLITK